MLAQPVCACHAAACACHMFTLHWELCWPATTSITPVHFVDLPLPAWLPCLHRYLQLPAGVQLHFVDSVQALASMGRHLDGLLRPHRHGSVHHSIVATDDAAAAAAVAGAEGEQLLQAAAVGAAGAAGSSASSASIASAADAPAASTTGADRDAELLPALGVDLEWQPDAENSSPPSLLQLSTGGWVELACSTALSVPLGVATRHSVLVDWPRCRTFDVLRVISHVPQFHFSIADSEVFLVDLLALAPHEAELAAALAPILTSDRVFKLGEAALGLYLLCNSLVVHNGAQVCCRAGECSLASASQSLNAYACGSRSTCKCFIPCAAHALLLMPADCCAQAAASPQTARSWPTTIPLPSAWCDHLAAGVDSVFVMYRIMRAPPRNRPASWPHLVHAPALGYIYNNAYLTAAGAVLPGPERDVALPPHRAE